MLECLIRYVRVCVIVQVHVNVMMCDSVRECECRSVHVSVSVMADL